MRTSLFTRTRVSFAACSLLALTAAPAAGNATTLTPAQSFGTYNLTLSDAFGIGSFGTVTVSDLGGGSAEFKVDVAPNFIVDTGSHFAFTYSLVGGTPGAVTSNATGPNASTYTQQAAVTATTSTGYANAPFSFFNNAIAISNANCSGGGCGTSQFDGSQITFDVTGFLGLESATKLYTDTNNVSHVIFFAVDILNTSCVPTADTSCTGVVGASLRTGGGNSGQTPLPGAIWLMGSVVGGGAGFRAWRRRRKLKAA